MISKKATCQANLSNLTMIWWQRVVPERVPHGFTKDMIEHSFKHVWTSATHQKIEKIWIQYWKSDKKCYVSYGTPCFVVLSSICCWLLRSPFGWKARCTRATPRQPKAFRCAENFENTKTATATWLPASTRICCAACGGWTAGRNLTKLQDIIMLSKCLCCLAPSRAISCNIHDAI